MLSKTSEYAIRALIYIAYKSKDGSKLGIKEVAEEIDSPVHFTGKILQTLAKQGLISSTKGPNGGFFIEAEAAPVPLMQVIHAIDGKKIFNGCVLGLKYCSDVHPCPIHDEYKSARTKLLKMFNERTIQDITKGSKKDILFKRTVHLRSKKD